MKSQAFYTSRPPLQAIDLAVVAQTREAHSLVQLFLAKQLSFGELQLAWRGVQNSLTPLGYTLKLFQKRQEGEDFYCVDISKTPARPFSPGLGFCFHCAKEATVRFDEKPWCKECLCAFLKEALNG